jgi:hypothetical protein
MSPADTPETFVIRPSPGMRVMSWVDALTVLLLIALASMMYSAMKAAAPASGDWFGLFLLGTAVVAIAVYRTIKAIAGRLPLVVMRDGRATWWRRQLSYAQPQRVLLKYVYRMGYRTYLEYGNGRLLARLDQRDTRAAEAFAVELAAFLGVSAYKDDGGAQKPRKLAKKAA